MFNLFIYSLALLSGILFIQTHPQMVNGIYPSYVPFNTLLKTAPFLLLSYFNPTCLILFFADLMMDIEYVLPHHKYRETGFYAGYLLYCLFHFVNIEYYIVPFSLAALCTPFLFKEMNFKAEHRIFLPYIFLIYARFFSYLISFNIIGALATACLGIGDIYLALDRFEKNMPHKDLVTMGTSYVHLFLVSLI